MSNLNLLLEVNSSCLCLKSQFVTRFICPCRSPSVMPLVTSSVFELPNAMNAMTGPLLIEALYFWDFPLSSWLFPFASEAQVFIMLLVCKRLCRSSLRAISPFGESREVTRVPLAKGDTSARDGESSFSSSPHGFASRSPLEMESSFAGYCNSFNFQLNC